MWTMKYPSSQLQLLTDACDFQWPSPLTRHGQPMLIELDFGSLKVFVA